MRRAALGAARRMAILTLARHATTKALEEGRYQGANDDGLSPDGVREAHLLRARCRVPEFDTVWVSDRRRALETAEIVFAGVPLRVDRRLRELDFGVFEGHTHVENLERFGSRYAVWVADPTSKPPPGGETVEELELRLREWLERVDKRERTAVVTHGGPIRLLLSLARRVPFSHVPAHEIPPASVIELETRSIPERLS